MVEDKIVLFSVGVLPRSLSVKDNEFVEVACGLVLVFVVTAPVSDVRRLLFCKAIANKTS